MNGVLMIVAGLMTAFSVAEAQHNVSLQSSAAADGIVEIQNQFGSVHITAQNEPEVRVTGTLEGADDKVEISRDGQRVRVVVKITKDRGDHEANLEIVVPIRSRLDIHTVSADVDIEGVTGRFEINTVSGNILSKGGATEVHAKTVSGTIDILQPTTLAQAETVSGEITVRKASGSLTATTVSGTISIQGGGSLERGAFSSISGDITLDIGISGKGRLTVSSISGEATLKLPSATSANLLVKTFSGTIASDFGVVEKRSNGKPSKELRTTLGNGSASISVDNLSGDISIKKR